MLQVKMFIVAGLLDAVTMIGVAWRCGSPRHPFVAAFKAAAGQ